MNDLRLNKESLLQALSIEQVDSLINGENLLKSGYSFYYVVDTFDLINYIYPFEYEHDNTFEDTKFNFKADEQIALYDVFKGQDKVVFLLDEYEREYVNLRNYAQYAPDNTQKTIEQVSGSLAENKIDNDFIKKHLSKFLSLAIGFSSQSVEKVREVKNRLMTKDEDFIAQNQDFSDGFISLFNSINFKEQNEDIIKFTEALFERIKNIVRERKILNNKDEYEIKRFLIAKYIDCRVITRTLFMNKALIERPILDAQGKKILLLYLSSNDSSRGIIRDSMTGYFPEIKNNGSFDFFRNTSQVFAQILFKNPDNQDDDTTKIGLEKIKNILSIRKKRQEQDEISEDILTVFKDKIDATRESFKNNGLLNDYKRYESIIRDAIQNNRFVQIKHFFLTLLESAKYDSGILKNASGKRDKELDELELIYNLKQNLIDRIKSQNITSHFQTIYTIKGFDPIYGHNHHLPILFLNTYRQSIDEIVDLCLKAGDFQLDKKQFFGLYIGIINKDWNVLEYSSNKHLLTGLLSTIFVSSREDILAIDEIDKGLHGILDLDKDVELYKDYLYLKCWALRRIERYSDSIATAKQGQKKDENDPRFCHGLAISYYSEYVSNTSKQESILNLATENYKLAILKYINFYSNITQNSEYFEDLETALTWYCKIRDANDKTPLVGQIDKSIAVVLYGVVLVLVLKFENHENTNYQLLTEARVLLDNYAKVIITTYKYGKVISQKYPEYLFNEAKLEYYEHINLFVTNSTTQTIIDKLTSANAAITDTNSIFQREEVKKLFELVTIALKNVRKSKPNYSHIPQSFKILNPTTHV